MATVNRKRQNDVTKKTRSRDRRNEKQPNI